MGSSGLVGLYSMYQGHLFFPAIYGVCFVSSLFGVPIPVSPSVERDTKRHLTQHGGLPILLVAHLSGSQVS